MSDVTPATPRAEGADYRIGLSVLEAIVRHVVAADPAVRLHQGVRMARGKTLDVHVDEGACRVSLDVDMHLGDNVPRVAAALQERVREQLEAMTGLTVEAVDVTVVSIAPPREPA